MQLDTYYIKVAQRTCFILLLIGYITWFFSIENNIHICIFHINNANVMKFISYI